MNGNDELPGTDGRLPERARAVLHEDAWIWHTQDPRSFGVLELRWGMEAGREVAHALWGVQQIRPRDIYL